MTICYREDEDDIEMSSSLYWPPTSPEELKIRADEASVIAGYVYQLILARKEN